jgi:hypothetical protein
MLERAWEKLDKFYLILAVVLTLMAVMVIVAFRGIFSAYLGASDISSKDTQISKEIDQDSLEEAYAWISNKTSVSLEIRD